MAESILEQIAQWHLAMINSITTANGYQQTLTGSRAEEQFLAGETIGDLDVLCCLAAGDGAVELEGQDLDPSGKVQWSQLIDAFVHLLGAAGTGLAVDQRITRIVADIHKRIGVEWTAAQTEHRLCCGGLVYRIDLLPWEIGVSADGACTVVNVPLRFAFEVQRKNPYAQ